MHIMLLLKQAYHAEEDIRQHLRVINRAMMVEFAEPKIFCKRIQLDVVDIRKDIARDRDRIDGGVIVLDTEIQTCFADETGIERCVMRAQYRAVAKFKETANSLFLGGSAFHHAVGDTGQLHDLCGDRTLGIGKGRESVHDTAVLDLDRADLRDLIVRCIESGRLQVEADKGSAERLVFVSVDRCTEIVDKVSLRAVDDLDLFAVAFQ